MKKLFFKIYILLFMVSVSMAVLPCQTVNAHGLFGEITASLVSESETEGEIRAVSRAERVTPHLKGENIFQIYFLLGVLTVVMSYLIYERRLPDRETIVKEKIRMND